MSGWVPMDAGAWMRERDQIAGPWPDVLVAFDLRFWADTKACDGRERPSIRILGETWGWAKSKAERFINAPEKWADPYKQRDTSGTGVGHQRDTSGTVDDGSTPKSVDDRDTSGTRVGHQWDTSGTPSKGSRARTPTHTPTPTPPPSEGVTPVPAWARNVRLPDGVARSDIVDVVVAAKDAAIGVPGNPERAGTASKAVLALWRAIGCPMLPAFRDELLLVIEAAKDCPDPLFARDIRAEGWVGGSDRHRDLGTLCRHDRWDVRLDAARRWDAAGRLTTATGGGARASPAPQRSGGMGDVARMLLEEMDDDADDATFTVETAWTT